MLAANCSMREGIADEVFVVLRPHVFLLLEVVFLLARLVLLDALVDVVGCLVL